LAADSEMCLDILQHNYPMVTRRPSHKTELADVEIMDTWASTISDADIMMEFYSRHDDTDEYVGAMLVSCAGTHTERSNFSVHEGTFEFMRGAQRSERRAMDVLMRENIQLRLDTKKKTLMAGTDGRGKEQEVLEATITAKDTLFADCCFCCSISDPSHEPDKLGSLHDAMRAVSLV